MSFLNYFKNIKSFSVVIIPDDAHHSSKASKYTPKSILIVVLLYTLIVTIIGYYLLVFSGIGKYMLPSKYGLQSADLKKVEHLDEQINFLVKELQNLKSTNEKLKTALILGDSAYVDSVSFIDDSLQVDENIQFEGNIYNIIKKMFSSNKSKQSDQISFIKPSEGFISRKFDISRGHAGIDIVVKDGSPVYSSAGGYIIFSEYTPDFGYVVIILHSYNYITFYKHCSSVLKRERDIVEQGELIALSGNSGTQSTGPHLHFEIWRDGHAIDPETVLLNY